jgi:hypothetical protein
MQFNVRTLAILSTAMLALAPVTHAQLGESPEQIGERYGNAVSANENKTAVLYRHAGMYIRVEYVQDRAEMIAYRKDPFTAMSPTEIETILSRHAQQDAWRKIDGRPGHRYWRSAGGKYIARYGSVNGLLTIMTAARHEKIAAPAASRRQRS